MPSAATDDRDLDARFRLAMASAGIGMAIVSLDGRFLEVNPALCRMLGRPAEALVGRRVHDFSHPDDLPLTEQLLAELLDGGCAAVEAEKRYLRADGEVLEVRLTSALMRDAEGAPGQLISQLVDITGQRQAERALRELNDALERRVAERTEALEAARQRLESFVYGVSHDLRAPLRTIDGFARQLEREAPPLADGQRAYLQRIRHAATRMGGLIDSLLELARVGRAELRPMRVDLSLLSEWVAAEMQDLQPEPLLAVRVQPGLAMVGDERLLRALLQQVLRNARQFSVAGETARVEVDGERRGKVLLLHVRDHGIGFDMAYAGKLFEPFQRLHAGDQGAGDGIGLSIAQQAAQRHAGRIWAESAPGAGSTFHIELHDLEPTEAQAA